MTAATTTAAATHNGALAYSHGMRSHEVPTFPDPNNSGQNNKQAIVSALQEVSNSHRLREETGDSAGELPTREHLAAELPAAVWMQVSRGRTAGTRSSPIP